MWGFVQALQLQRSLDDVEQSVALVEKELANEDCGADLPSVNRLLKALQGLEEELDGHRDRIQVQQLHLCVVFKVRRQSSVNLLLFGSDRP